MNRNISQIILIVFFTIFLQTGVVKAAALGEGVSFNIDSTYAATGNLKISATLQDISQHAYFYTEDEWWGALGGDKFGTLQNLADEFDRTIYPTLRNNIGFEWRPGIDGDERITILLVRLKDNAGGYFNLIDEYPVTTFSNSNSREMVYLNAKNFTSSRLRSFLVHEFQHLITFFQKDKLNGVDDEIFLNEARSEYASTLVGYDNYFPGSNLEARVSDFLKQPSNSLTEWQNQSEDYGSANLFMQYLVEHYGVPILNHMIIDQKIGIESVNNALASLSFKKTFTDVFADWTIALYLNDCRVGEMKTYCFLNSDLREKLKSSVAPTSAYTLPPSGINAMMVASVIKDWSPRWYKLTGGNQNLKIDFSGDQNTQFIVPYIISKSTGENQVKFFDLKNQQGTIYVASMGTDVVSVTLAPITTTKLKDFTNNEPYHYFSFSATIVSEIPPDNPVVNPPVIISPSYPEGSLIRAKGDDKVYVVSGKYKRWIQSPYIFNSYGHLRWENIIEVSFEDRDWYQDSYLVRADGDYRVYEINADSTKHWLNMTTDKFVSSGRDWGEIFVINTRERDYYRSGANINL